MTKKRFQYLSVVSMGILLAAILISVVSDQHLSIPISTPTPTAVSPTSIPESTSIPETILPSGLDVSRSISVLVDDFEPQPYQGESVYFFNRLEGDRGAINDSILDWGNGQVTTTISSGKFLGWGMDEPESPDT